MLKSYGKEQMDTKHLGYLGQTLKESDVTYVTYVTIDGYYQWADYGTRSIVPVIITFVIDEFGVRAQYKTGGGGNLRSPRRGVRGEGKGFQQANERISTF